MCYVLSTRYSSQVAIQMHDMVPALHGTSTAPIPDHNLEFALASCVWTTPGSTGNMGAFSSLCLCLVSQTVHCRILSQWEQSCRWCGDFGYQHWSLKLLGMMIVDQKKDYLKFSEQGCRQWYTKAKLLMLTVVFEIFFRGNFSLHPTLYPFSSLLIPAVSVTLYQWHKKLLDCMQIRAQNLHLAKLKQ